jgi:regulator of protease activity HflC (stomatin/prohibitin superfamily)
MEKGALICLATCVVLSLIVILLLISMDSIEPLNYGIQYNKITKSISTETYENGRYIMLPWKTFITYPSNLVTIEFSDNRGATAEPLQTRTIEGLGLTLYVSFQYEINRTHIPDLYNMNNLNYHSTFVRISRDVLLKVGGQYNATNYWTSRTAIGDEMKKALDTELIKAYARCRFLQILRIDLPKTYEDSIVATQVEVQKTNMRKFEQTAELIRQNISVIVSDADYQIKVINATGNANATIIKQQAIVFIYLI